MMNDKEELKKKRIMGLRLSEKLYELLVQKSEEFEMSKSEVLRLSFEFFAEALQLGRPIAIRYILSRISAMLIRNNNM